MKTKEVIIHVSGGVAEVVKKPKGIRVTILDFDGDDKERIPHKDISNEKVAIAMIRHALKYQEVR